MGRVVSALYCCAEKAMTKKRILEIIEDMLQLGKITEQRINYNRALLDLAQKIIEEVDEDDDMQMARGKERVNECL